MVNKQRTTGFTLIELLIVITVIGILTAAIAGVYFLFFTTTLRTNNQARLSVESQDILRSVVEELRVSSGVRQDSVPDSHVVGGGSTWQTNNSNLVLIIAKPAVNTSNQVLINTSLGEPYMNEIVYFAIDSTLYKRYLADSTAPGNKFTTSCPLAYATATCPADVELSKHFKDMTFVFYDGNNAVINQTSGDITEAHSVTISIVLEHHAFGQTVSFSNDIRMTLRNEP